MEELLANLETSTEISKFATFVISKEFPEYRDREDLIQEAVYLILKAKNKFDPNYGSSISTYMYRVIQSGIYRYKLRTDYPMSHFGNLGEKMKKIKDAKDKHGEDLSIKELSEITGMTEKVLWDTTSLIRGEVGLNPEMLEILPNPNSKIVEHIEEEVDQIFRNLELEKMMSILSEREKYVIVKIYGISGHTPKTPKDIAGELGVTRNRIHQLHQASIKKMRANHYGYKVNSRGKRIE